MIFIALTAGTVACQWAVQSVDAVQQTGGGREADLRDRLTTVLRVRTDPEKDFVEAVVAKVTTGDIPRELVDSTLLWVRSNRADSPYPFFYFERVLRIRGQRAGIAIPAYSGGIPSGTNR
ncbi:MAG: hypothetical protein R3B96_03175 [Pirellulaceae bacterium]|nr:hypothetical protein [Planctomycetales bacterium]